MRIVLSGGTGFIGSHFLSLALADGHSVNAISRSSNSATRIPLKLQPSWIYSSLDAVQINHLKDADVFVHLAAHTANVPYDSLQNCLRWNLNASIDLFEKARLAGIQNFIVAGSCFEYGLSGENYTSIPSDAPLEPTNSYSVSKAAASLALLCWAREYNLNLEILRIFQVFGEGESNGRFWPSLRTAALSGEDFMMTKGEQIRDFQSVELVAKTFLQRSINLQSKPQSVEVFNLSSGCPCSLGEFALAQWRFFNAAGELCLGRVPYRKNEVMRYIPGENMILINEI